MMNGRVTLQSAGDANDFDRFATINTFFFPTVYAEEPVSRVQTISFLTDASVLLSIWHLEAVRRANRLTPIQL